jgi:hypothetical protein
MIVLADNDIVGKLACCDLLPELMAWLKAPPAEIWVLPTMPFVLRKKLKNNAGALVCLERFLLQVKPIPQAQLESLDRFSRLDVGESQMLAVLVDDSTVTHMVTGDKRALKLIGEMACTDVALFKRLKTTQVDCLESIMLGLIDQFGYATVNAKAIHGLHSDTVLKISFGQQRNQTDARQALTSYLNDVRKTAPFVSPP